MWHLRLFTTSLRRLYATDGGLASGLQKYAGHCSKRNDVSFVHRLRSTVHMGETLHKNYQAICDTFLYCVLRKFWGGVSCLCLVLLVYFLESIFLALCMFMRRGASALGTGKPAVLLFGVATPRGAMACRPRVDPSILIHRDPRAWEELLGWGRVEN